MNKNTSNRSVNFDYPLDIFYDQKMVDFYCFYEDLVFYVNTVLFSLLVYVNLTQSSSMPLYRWYILNSTIWSYAAQIVTHFWKAVPLFPYFIGYSAGIFGPILGFKSGFVFLMVFGCLAINTISSIFACFIMRYYAAVSPGDQGRIYRVNSIRFQYVSWWF